MATRSTGQVEEGRPGFSIAAVDRRGVSWRFKALAAIRPFVLITHPTHRRLSTRARRASGGALVVRAKVLSDAPITAVETGADDGTRTPMRPAPGGAALWEAPIRAGMSRVAVRACDANGREDEDRVEPASDGSTAPERHADGSDAERVGAWPERGIAGTQLGPNRNGRKC